MTDMVSLSTLCSRMTRELRRVEARLSNLENAIGDIILRDVQRPHSRRFLELQEIDRARQEVSGIAEFLEHLSVVACPGCAVDAHMASRSLGLADLAAALVRGESVQVEFGEFETFV